MSFTEQEKQLILYGKANGKSQAEVEQALVRLRTGIKPEPKVAPVVTPSAGEQIVEAGKAGLEKTGEALAAKPSLKNTLRAGSGIVETAFAPLAPLFAPIAEGFRKLTDYISNTKPLKEFGLGTADMPADQQTTAESVLEDVSNASNIIGTIAGGKPSLTAVKTGASKTASAVANTADDAFKAALDLRKNVQVTLAKKSVNPQLQSSAERLFLEGTKRVDDPISTYNKYLSQSKTALTDIKVDPAIAEVGNQIGDAFKAVVAQRRAVGATMGEELKKVGTIKTDILPTADKFRQNLASEGLVYDRVTRLITQTAKQTKMTADDVKLLETFASELQKLGSKPTISELDAFMSRIPNEINVYKSSKGITGTTNGERIIKQSLSDLRSNFDPAKTGNTALTGYAAARKAYADLSDFIDDGTPFLGKLTQSGDFAKDASIAKSAVQSILNNGKKDWMIRLEALTGYPAIDEAVLALQAMKDAGDFRGLSLLQAMSEGAVPTSKSGFTQKIIDFAIEKGSRAIAGTPEEQTRAFLNDLMLKSRQ